ncbi:MAG TPA: YfhO family protein, partial [Pyrinomonadaceae bacterium]|nr:YfhO family protein [Pyrinomonadaceae bacterium]
LFQYVPAVVLSRLGFSEAAVLHALAYLSFLAFVASALLIYWTLKRKASEPMALAGLLIVSSGPLLWYSHSTYGEMAAAFLILAFTAACLLRARNGVIIPLFILAGATKEIAFPFLLLIGLLSLLPEVVRARAKVRGRIYALIAGAGLSMIVTVAFNYFRYATYYNRNYLTDIALVPSFRLQLSFFLGIWFSPNGGLLFFWPSFALLYFSVLAMTLLRKARSEPSGQNGEHERGLIFYLPIITVSLVLFLLTFGFSRWYTPLGGAAWGPRFMLPWIPAVSLLLLFFYAREVSSMLSPVLREPLGLALACAALIVASLPQLMVLFESSMLGKIFAPTPACPRLPSIQEDVNYYYRCIEAQIWPHSSVLREALLVALKPSVFWFAVSYAALLVGGCVWMRKLLRGSEPSAKTKAAMTETTTPVEADESEPPRAFAGPIGHSLSVLLFYSLLFTLFFSPALLGDALLAPGDGIPIFLPNFYSRKVLWDALLFSGFPMFADPQVMMWYPLSIVASHLPGTWNIFVISAYVLASCFMYGYVYSITRSRLSGLMSGLIYGMSGFMMAHLGHTGIIHCVAWFPLIIWSLEMLRRRWNPLWMVAGSIAVACSFLAGHSQLFFYGLALGVAYALTLGWKAPVARLNCYLYSLALISLGLGLAAIQIIPTAELVGQSVRAEFTYADFVSYSLPPKQLAMFVFPALFGGVSNHPTSTYFGNWNLTELMGYTGLLPLMLAAIGFAAARQKRLALFWLSVGVLALLLALGESTPLARLTYLLPLFNRFRVPARHLIEMAFAVSVLAGLGLSAIRREKAARSLVPKTIAAATLVMLGCLSLILAFRDQLAAVAAHRGAGSISFLPWTNRAVGLPLILFLIAALGLAYWSARPDSRARTALLLLVLLLDLGSYGWFSEWRYASPPESQLMPPAKAQTYSSALAASHQRLLPVMGIHGPLDDMPPNISRLWGVPSATGNNVLRLKRVSHALAISEGGDIVDPTWSEPYNRSLDLMAIRYLFVPYGKPLRDESGVSWPAKDAEIWLGSGCGKPRLESKTFNFPKPIRATRLGLATMLACSTNIADGTEMVRVTITDSAGRAQTGSLLAGRDSSEWSYDCGNIKPQMKHGRAAVFNSFPAQMYDVPCEGHYYRTMLDLDSGGDISSIHFQWTGPAGALVIQKISLIDEASKTYVPLHPSDMDSARWRLVEESSESRAYENLRALPRVWLASEVLRVAPEEAMKAVKTSRLADGRPFDPARTALVEEALDFARQEREADSSASSAEVAYLSDTVMEVRTSSASPAFLVTADPYYPGWQAKIDGQPARLFSADYALRGVVLPAGSHLVRFEFKPRSYYYGAAICALSLLVLAAILAKALLSGRRRGASLSH